MIWDSENRLVNIANSDGSSEQNTYSADGLRKSKTSSGTTTVFTWDEQNLLLETNTSNVIQARYTDFPGFWGGSTSQNRSGTSSFYLYDTQGSVRNLASILGAITDTYVFTAFGVELLTSGTTVNPYRYVGMFACYWDYSHVYLDRKQWRDAATNVLMGTSNYVELMDIPIRRNPKVPYEPRCSSGFIDGVPKSDPRYPCYAELCQERARVIEWIDELRAYLGRGGESADGWGLTLHLTKNNCFTRQHGVTRLVGIGRDPLLESGPAVALRQV